MPFKWDNDVERLVSNVVDLLTDNSGDQLADMLVKKTENISFEMREELQNFALRILWQQHMSLDTKLDLWDIVRRFRVC